MSAVCLLFCQLIYRSKINNNFRAKILIKARFARFNEKMRLFLTFSNIVHAEFLDFWLSNRRIEMVARDNFSLRGIQWWWVDNVSSRFGKNISTASITFFIKACFLLTKIGVRGRLLVYYQKRLLSYVHWIFTMLFW